MAVRCPRRLVRPTLKIDAPGAAALVRKPDRNECPGSSLDRITAIDRNRRTGNEIGRWACQEYGNAREVVDDAPTCGRRAAQHILMARLWRDQGKSQEARDLLAPVYGCFSEGFRTLDLIEAKTLVETLA